MDTDKPYISAAIVQVMEFKVFYPEVYSYPTIESLLESIPRQELIRVVQLLENIFKGPGFENVQKFFSPESSELKKDFNRRVCKYAKTEVQYLFSTSQTSLELLKYAFAIEFHPKKLKVCEIEENLLKAILIINEQRLNVAESVTVSNPFLRIAAFAVMNSFSNKDIDTYNIHDVYREIFPLSIDTFEYISNDEYFKPIYKEFLENVGVNSYQEYIVSIIFIISVAFTNKSVGTFKYDKKKDPDNLLRISVLDYISVNVEDNIAIQYNEDYKIFRDNPLVKTAPGVYEIINLRFLLERLFSSLYFDFKNIAQELGLKGFENRYTESFMEKGLLVKYINKINKNNRYEVSLSDEDCKKHKGKTDDGEPDYYLRSDQGSIILFECKDILINSRVKVSRSYEMIIKEFQNKLFHKTFNSSGPVKKPKSVGVGQLIDQIVKLQNQKAFWDKSAQPNARIYPVLILSDSKLLPDGMPILLQEWYQSRCEKRSVNKENSRPLIVMSISTLLLYADEFGQKGLEHYFEKYYRHLLNTENDCLIDSQLKFANLSVSFTDYMNKVHHKDFDLLFQEYHSKLITHFKI